MLISCLVCVLLTTGKPLGRVILTTIYENKELLFELLGATPTVECYALLWLLAYLDFQAFQPSIPNLVYQYNLYTNYNSVVFNQKNPEIPE